MNLTLVPRFLQRNESRAQPKIQLTMDLTWQLMLAGTALVGLALLSLAWFKLKPTLNDINSLTQERIALTEFISDKSSHFSKAAQLPPGIVDLPEIVGRCEEAFRSQGVHVTSVNMENIGSKNLTQGQKQYSAQRQSGTQKSDLLEAGLFRFRVKGQWPQILAAVSALENSETYAIHVQEIILDEAGGNLLLQIYYTPEK
ncbi:hypothetical protein [Paradesulfitobacterium ferrireducens]|uniref:hypothetical protein n=1 Tax=Paradesulfitobacterium ferrireducens TaxID=2816476 RepID=UPI001A8E9E84|nr:hypothetical protein [Paradesulfitobacterium ferrireducens]